jgi:predicted transcriptional regulator of viral defense system
MRRHTNQRVRAGKIRTLLLRKSVIIYWRKGKVILLGKFDALDTLLRENNGFLKTSEAVKSGVSKVYFGEYVRRRGLARVALGLYMSPDAWDDGLYVIQVRYPTAIFSHETALYLFGLADREPLKYSLTVKTGTNTAGLDKQGVKVYRIKESLFEEGLTETKSTSGHTIRVYGAERTLCDLFRYRNSVEIQDLQTATREYVRLKEKNIPLLMRYAKLFSVEKVVRQYLGT